MTTHLCFLVKLREGVTADEFETFLRDVEHPLLREIPSAVRQRALRVQGFFEDVGRPLPAHFVDVIEVTDVDTYGEELAAAEGTPAFERFVEGWGRLVEHDHALRVAEAAAWSRGG